MTVHGAEYRMWAALARREDLPEEAFAAVVDGLLPDDVDTDAWSWQKDVFKETIPALLARVSDQDLRDRIVAAAEAGQVNALIRQGVLGPADIPGVLRHHEATPDLVVSLARRDEHRQKALEVIETQELSALVAIEMSAGLPQPEEPVLPAPEVPDWLLDALVRRSLTIITAGLQVFTAANSQPRDTPYWQPEGWPPDSVCGLLLKRCPERWLELVEDPVHGQAVRHVLLDGVDTAQISDEVLAACVPALCLPEWADLPVPERTH